MVGIHAGACHHQSHCAAAFPSGGDAMHETYPQTQLWQTQYLPLATSTKTSLQPIWWHSPSFGGGRVPYGGTFEKNVKMGS